MGDTIISSKEKELEIVPGNCMPLANMPLGTVVHNVELMPGRGGQMARAAGASATLLDKRGRPGYALVAITSKVRESVCVCVCLCTLLTLLALQTLLILPALRTLLTFPFVI